MADLTRWLTQVYYCRDQVLAISLEIFAQRGSEHTGGKLAFVGLLTIQISQDAQKSAVALGVLLYEVDKADELRVLGQECLESEQELVEAVLLERYDTTLVVGDDEALDEELADGHLELGLFISNFLVDEHAVDQLVDDFPAVDKLSELEAIVGLMGCLGALEGLDNPQSLVEPPQEPLSDLRVRQ